MPIPDLNSFGELPPGIHVASVAEVENIFGKSSDRRKILIKGLKQAIKIFKNASVPRIFVDGSFTSSKIDPNDIDGCWSAEGANLEKLDPRFWDFEDTKDFQKKREEIKCKYGLDFFIAELIEGGSGRPFPEFFQTNRNGDFKGIVQINL